MKYLFITILFIFGNMILSAQDTLHLKKNNKDLIAQIKLIKRKTLFYTVKNSKGLKKISLRKVKKITFSDDTGIEERKEVFVEKKEEFQTTIFLQSVGLVNQTQTGFNYMHRLSPALTKKASCWVQFGGGLNIQRQRRRRTRGYYLEFGTRVELANKRKPKNRFYIGLDINHRWIKKEKILISGLAMVNRRFTPVEESEISLQIPIGFTFRSDKGFYVSSGVEVSTQKLFPSLGLSVGYSFR